LTNGATATREVQALVRALAAGRDVAEMGAAFGETAAFLAETARSVVTVERDPERVVVARERWPGSPTSSCSRGTYTSSWMAVAPSVSSSPTAAALTTGEAILALTGPGGLIVKDDLTPGRPVEGDDVREFLLRDPRLAATEILATPDMAVIVAAVF
jgi:hypothetical protein